jgi:hypothetical protein
MNRNAAFELAIKALDTVRKKYAVGHNAYIANSNFKEFERDYQHYKEYTKAIAIMEGERDHQQLEMRL